MSICILCGKALPTIDDLCADCHMEAFYQSLEPAKLHIGDAVQYIKRGDLNYLKVGKVIPSQGHRPWNIESLEYWIEIDENENRVACERGDLKFLKRSGEM